METKVVKVLQNSREKLGKLTTGKYLKSFFDNWILRRIEEKRFHPTIKLISIPQRHFDYAGASQLIT